jgi:hypothetical protein
MSWESEMGTLVRHLVDDLTTPYTYADSRIEQTIATAAQLAIFEIDFEQVYTVSLDCPTITPDPTLAAAKDDSFINLVSLKAGCIILGSEIKTEAAKSITVTDGPSTINMGNNFKGVELAFKTLCEQYEDMKLQYKASGNIGTAILSPYSPGSDTVRTYVRRNQL